MEFDSIYKPPQRSECIVADDEVDTQHNILSSKKNWSEFSDSSPVRSYAVPHGKATHHSLQWIGGNTPVVKTVVDGLQNNVALKNSSAGEIILSERGRAQPTATTLSRIETSRLVTSTETRDSTVNLDDDIGYERETYLVVDSTKSSNLNTVIRVIVKPLSECNVKNLSFNQNFNDVLKDLKFEYEYNDMILQPHVGYVIATRRRNNGQIIYVNVCHHEKVGLLTAKQSTLLEYTAKLASDGSLQDKTFPYIIGSINNFSDKVANSGKLHPAAAAATVDVVIPSSLWKLMADKNDITGEIRQNVRF